MKNILLFSLLLSTGTAYSQKKPNVIVIFTDDQGYQDIGCYGSPLIKTPRLDKMAGEGIKLTDFYVSSSVSSASRAGLLTGRRNTKNGVKGVFWPDNKGLPNEEITIAEALKENGYATGCFGKWHLGDLQGHMPLDQGFYKYFGIPYSNDMYIGYSQRFASNVKFLDGYTLERAKADQEYVRTTNDKKDIIKKKLNYASPLIEDSLIVEYPCKQSTTTERYFDKAMEFIESSGDKPFFAYITPSMPHVPLFASEKFKGKSKRGLYGDAVEEIDWNVGRLLDFLDEKGLSENTIVVFSSDNGPWLGQKENGGCALPFRDGKFSIYEGGVRTPCIIRWKGNIPEGKVSNSIIWSIDLFPTFMHYADCNNFKRKIDGIELSSFLKDPSIKVHDYYLYVKDGIIKGVRKGPWVYLPQTGSRNPKKDAVPELFNLDLSIDESDNILQKNPQKLQEMQQLLLKYQSADN